MSAKKTTNFPAIMAAAVTGWRQHSRRILIVTGVCLAVLAVVLFMMPIWMQSPQGRVYSLEHIQRKTGLKISARNWSLGWFSATTFENLEINAPGGSVVTAEKLTTELSLFDYLRGHWDLGSTVITEPRLKLMPGDVRQLAQSVSRANALRGSITLKGGTIRLMSSQPNRFLECAITEAQIPIASTDTAVHASFTGQTFNHGQSYGMTATATLPPVEQWLNREAWLRANVAVFAGGVPTDVVAEWSGLNPQWQASLGDTVTINAVVGPSVNNPSQREFSLNILGTEGYAKFAGQVREQDREIFLVIRAPQGTGEFEGNVAGAMIPTLSWLNPVFLSAHQGRVHASLLNLEVSNRNWRTGKMAGVMTISNLALLPDGVLSGLLTVAGAETPTIGKLWQATLSPLRFTVENGRTNCTDFQINVGSRTIRMTGEILIDGQVRLFATVPAQTAGPLSTATITVPVRGTVDAPAVSAAE